MEYQKLTEKIILFILFILSKKHKILTQWWSDGKRKTVVDDLQPEYFLR